MVKSLLKLDTLFAPDDTEVAVFTLTQDETPAAKITFDFSKQPFTVNSESLLDTLDHYDLACAIVVASEMIHAFFDDVERPDDYDFYSREI